MIQEYRQIHDPKGLAIQAVKLEMDNADQIAAWCGGIVVEEIDPFDSSKRQPGINVPTPSGNVRCSLGGYVYFGYLTGNPAFDVASGHTFEQTWAVVEDPPEEPKVIEQANPYEWGFLSADEMRRRI